MDIKNYILNCKASVNTALNKYLPQETTSPENPDAAMSTALNGRNIFAQPLLLL
ncbi:MAG: hypothetical protein LCH30_06585 [Proteobacteria bacterium]|nr:hypothetical protein [Pseudomonadota bacterium]